MKQNLTWFKVVPTYHNNLSSKTLGNRISPMSTSQVDRTLSPASSNSQPKDFEPKADLLNITALNGLFFH